MFYGFLLVKHWLDWYIHGILVIKYLPFAISKIKSFNHLKKIEVVDINCRTNFMPPVLMKRIYIYKTKEKIESPDDASCLFYTSMANNLCVRRYDGKVTDAYGRLPLSTKYFQMLALTILYLHILHTSNTTTTSIGHKNKRQT